MDKVQSLFAAGEAALEQLSTNVSRPVTAVNDSGIRCPFCSVEIINSRLKVYSILSIIIISTIAICDSNTISKSIFGSIKHRNSPNKNILRTRISHRTVNTDCSTRFSIRYRITIAITVGSTR